MARAIPRGKSAKQRALRQLAGLALLTGTLVIGGVLSEESPADAAQLRIPIGELRSDAAELAAIQVDLESGRLSVDHARRHLRQLGTTFDASLGKLAALDVVPALAPLQRDALALGRELERRLDDVGASGDRNGEAAAQLRDDLQRMETRLRRPV